MQKWTHSICSWRQNCERKVNDSKDYLAHGIIMPTSLELNVCQNMFIE